MIIIPDTHGLDFWKDAVSKRQDNEKIIFLGDYLDPHGGKINKAAFEQCFDNLCQILEFKKVNEKSCILLFGNHELSYLFGWWTTNPHNFCRHFAYKKFLKNEISNFQLMHIEQYDSKPFLFSHAGVHPSWIKKYVKQKYNCPLNDRSVSPTS